MGESDFDSEFSNNEVKIPVDSDKWIDSNEGNIFPNDWL